MINLSLETNSIINNLCKDLSSKPAAKYSDVNSSINCLTVLTPLQTLKYTN